MREWELFSSYSTDHDGMKWYVTRATEISIEVTTPEKIRVVEHSNYAALEAKLAESIENHEHFADLHKEAQVITIPALEAKLEKAKAALQFYAQQTNLYGEKTSQYNTDFENYGILADKGSVARQALKELE